MIAETAIALVFIALLLESYSNHRRGKDRGGDITRKLVKMFNLKVCRMTVHYHPPKDWGKYHACGMNPGQSLVDCRRAHFVAADQRRRGKIARSPVAEYVMIVPVTAYW